MEQFAAMANIEVAHLALDATRIEPPTAAHAAAGGNLLDHRVAPLRQPLRGERPQLAAFFA